MDRRNNLSTLDSLLLVNSIVQIGAGLSSMFAPRFLANPQSWNILKAEEWNRGPVVIGLRNLFGCASMSLGVLTLVSFVRPHEKPTTPILASLAFYHVAVVGPIIANEDFFQIPMGIIHSLLGFGFINFALKAV